MGGDLGVDDPTLPRRRKTPKRYETGTGGDFPEDVESRYRRIFYEALDLITSAIESRFQQPGYNVYSKLEDVLVKAATRKISRKTLSLSVGSTRRI